MSNETLVEIISNMPSLKENGQFSRARYEAALRGQGHEPEQFEAQLRQDLTMQQLVGAVSDTGIVPATVAETMRASSPKNDRVAEVRMMPDQFVGDVMAFRSRRGTTRP